MSTVHNSFFIDYENDIKNLPYEKASGRRRMNTVHKYFLSTMKILFKTYRM
jgi:hypothetical protein